MSEIILKSQIELFGFKDGFNFWFSMNFIDKIKIFYWKYIIAKPLCTYHGYFLCKPDCKYPKIYGRRNIIKYERERHREIDKQSKTIREGKDGMCFYCGEEKGTEIIDDPNWDTLERWKVCKTCKEVIGLQRELSFPLIPMKRQQEINDGLLEVSKQTGKPILNAQIEKKGDGYKFSYTKFTGEK